MKIGRFAFLSPPPQREPVDPKIQVEAGGRLPTNHSSSQKTRLNDLSYGIKMWTDLFPFLSQFTHLIDRWTDGRLSHRRPRLHSMQRGYNCCQRPQDFFQGGQIRGSGGESLPMGSRAGAQLLVSRGEASRNLRLST